MVTARGADPARFTDSGYCPEKMRRRHGHVKARPRTGIRTPWFAALGLGRWRVSLGSRDNWLVVHLRRFGGRGGGRGERTGRGPSSSWKAQRSRLALSAAYTSVHPRALREAAFRVFSARGCGAAVPRHRSCVALSLVPGRALYRRPDRAVGGLPARAPPLAEAGEAWINRSDHLRRAYPHCLTACCPDRPE